MKIARLLWQAHLNEISLTRCIDGAAKTIAPEVRWRPPSVCVYVCKHNITNWKPFPKHSRPRCSREKMLFAVSPVRVLTRLPPLSLALLYCFSRVYSHYCMIYAVVVVVVVCDFFSLKLWLQWPLAIRMLTQSYITDHVQIKHLHNISWACRITWESTNRVAQNFDKVMWKSLELLQTFNQYCRTTMAVDLFRQFSYIFSFSAK